MKPASSFPDSTGSWDYALGRPLARRTSPLATAVEGGDRAREILRLGRTVALSASARSERSSNQRIVTVFCATFTSATAECRRSWWLDARPDMFANQWGRCAGGTGDRALLNRAPSAKQIADVQYDPLSKHAGC